MADATNPMQGLPSIQDLIGNLVGQIEPNMRATSNEMGALQDYIKTQQRDQLNIPALQFAAGLLKPTKTGSFAESVGQGGEGALEALQKQRSVDLDRHTKIVELQQAKGQLLAQQTQMLLPYAQMMQAQSILGGGTGAGAGPGTAPGPGGAEGAGAVPGAASAEAGAAKAARYQQQIKQLMIWNKPLAEVLQKQMETDPDIKAYTAGLSKGAEKAAEAPYEFVEVTNPDGSKSKVPLSQVARPGGARPAPQLAPAPSAAGPSGGGATIPAASPGGPGLQVAPSASANTALEIAGMEAKKVPDAIMSLEQQDQRMEAINKVMQTFESGAGAEIKADAVAAARAIGLKVPDMDTANPTALQEFRKNSIGEVFDKLKEFGGQVKVAEITGLGKVVTDPELQPGANAAISAQVRGVIDWRKAMLTDYTKAYESGQITKPGTWYSEWTQAHPLGEYVANRLAATPVAGVPAAKVPVGGLGIAPIDVPSFGLKKGDKFIRLGTDKFLPLAAYPDYLRESGK